ncbi:hypothetical protein Droror1_Dr00019896 [Drosera rotundifolia]
MPFPADGSSDDTPLAWAASHLSTIAVGFPPASLGNQDSNKDRLDRLGNYPNSGVDCRVDKLGFVDKLVARRGVALFDSIAAGEMGNTLILMNVTVLVCMAAELQFDEVWDNKMSCWLLL